MAPPATGNSSLSTAVDIYDNSQQTLTTRGASMETPKRARVLSVIAAVVFVAVAMTAGYRRIGVPPVVIVGGSSLVALVMWIRTYLRRPLDPEIILPGFLLTVAALEVHMIEEISGLVHFHRSGSRGVHALHLPHPQARDPAPARRLDIPSRVERSLRGRHAQLLGQNNGRVLLPGHVHGDSADDTRHLYDPESDHGE